MALGLEHLYAKNGVCHSGAVFVYGILVWYLCMAFIYMWHFLQQCLAVVSVNMVMPVMNVSSQEISILFGICMKTRPQHIWLNSLPCCLLNQIWFSVFSFYWTNCDVFLHHNPYMVYTFASVDSVHFIYINHA